MRRSRLFLLLGIALLALSLAGLWQWRVREANGSAGLARGLAALDKGDARTARIELMNAIKANPRSPAVRVAQARALIELEDGAGAQAELVRARALGVRAADSRALMADALLLQGNVDAALKEAGSQDVPAQSAAAAAHVTGRAYMARNDMAAAQAAMANALTLAPGDARGWVDLGQLRLAMGDQAGAIVAADRALALAPADPRALTQRGMLVRDQYGLMASLPWFERALAANPASIPALTEYAATLADVGQAGPMLSVTRRILALDPANPRAWFMQAVMAARAGRIDLSRALLTRTGGRLDDQPATLLLRGILHLADGNAVLAADMLGALVAQQPDNRVARTLLARADYLMGDHQAVLAVLDPLLTRRDADPYVLTLAARAQEALGQRDAADQYLVRASWPVRPASDLLAGGRYDAPADAATAGDNIPYIRNLLRDGRTADALDRAAMLSRANPGAPAAHIVLGDVLDAAGRPAEAIKAYETAANIRFDRAVALRLVSALDRSGDPARAMQVARLFLSQNPMDVEAQRLGATAYIQLRDWRSALRLLQAVRAQVGDNDALLMADMARAMLETGDGVKARVYAAHAYRLMPANPVMADIYGLVLLRTKASGPASVDLLEKAVALAPRHPMFQLHLGQAYAAAGRRQEAKLALSRAAAANFPDRQQAVKALAAL